MDHDFRNRELRFSIYGLQASDSEGGLISADVFSRTLRSFIAALKEADVAANKRVGHNFVISHLKLGSAEVGILERAKEINDAAPVSSIGVFEDYADAMQKGNFEALEHSGMVSRISAISAKAGVAFSHIDLAIDRVATLRIDDFFDDQARAAVQRKNEAKDAKAHAMRFSGTAIDAFDGALKEVDLRGSIWRGKLVLSGTKKEVDCILKGLNIDDLGTNLDKRIWAEGLAIYSETSSLPVRFEINRIRPIAEDGENLNRWGGKVTKPLNASWDGILDNE